MRILDTATSALGAFSVDMMVRANNIANVNTPGFKAQTLSLMTGPQDMGVTIGRLGRDSSPGAMMPDTAYGTVEGSNTDLAREFTHMVGTSAAYKANATVIRSQEEMSGYLLDMLA